MVALITMIPYAEEESANQAVEQAYKIHNDLARELAMRLEDVDTHPEMVVTGKIYVLSTSTLGEVLATAVLNGALDKHLPLSNTSLENILRFVRDNLELPWEQAILYLIREWNRLDKQQEKEAQNVL